MQTPRGFIGIAAEFAARVKGAKDHFKRGFAGKFRMWINRDAAPVVADRDGVIRVQLDLDPVGMARHRFVHGVVENFGDKMMQRAFIGAADIHTGALSDGFEPFQYLDRGRIIVGRFVPGEEVFGHVCCSVFVALRHYGRAWRRGEASAYVSRDSRH